MERNLSFWRNDLGCAWDLDHMTRVTCLLRQIIIHLWTVMAMSSKSSLVMCGAVVRSNPVMQMAWVMQVQQNHNTKKWPWLSTNIYHLFQRCPCKMMSKTSEAGIHMYMMKAHELMGVWGCRGREEILFFFVSCPLLTNTVMGSHDRSCCFHAFSFCLYLDAGQRVLPL